MLSLIRIIATALILALPSYAHAAPKTIHFVLSANTPSYQAAVSQIKQALPSDGAYRTQVVEDAVALSMDHLGPDDLVVTVGNKAAEVLTRKHIKNETIYSFIDKSVLDQIRTSMTSSAWAATVTDPSISRLINVAEVISRQRDRRNILIPVSKENTPLLQEVGGVKRLHDDRIQMVVIPEDEKAAKVIEEYMYDAAVIVAGRDKGIWSGEDVEWMFYQAYRYKIPIVGYSPKFLKAGALVSVSLPITSIAQKTAQTIHQWMQADGPKRPVGIIYATEAVEFNESVARALQLPTSALDALGVGK